ncbi:phospholipase [Porphyromonas pogonae]|uniref:phospholipase n=1 Tax=Porphyromonas pogonae TaxID=867595 RepID=UPI002E77188E|nr:phospholipase [Porphyromonas pogonae]
MGILWIILGLFLLGVVAAIIGYYQNKSKEKRIARGEVIEEPEPLRPEGCCGMHITCEKDSLLAAVSPRIVYYDDEELDAYCNKPSDEYTSQQTDQFREVLYTLREEDVPGWLRSLQLRQIALPDELKSEAFLIVGEHRVQHAHDL